MGCCCYGGAHRGHRFTGILFSRERPGRAGAGPDNQAREGGGAAGRGHKPNQHQHHEPPQGWRPLMHVTHTPLQQLQSHTQSPMNTLRLCFIFFVTLSFWFRSSATGCTRDCVRPYIDAGPHRHPLGRVHWHEVADVHMHKPESTSLSYAFVHLAILHACSSISHTFCNCLLAVSIFIMRSYLQPDAQVPRPQPPTSSINYPLGINGDYSTSTAFYGNV